MTTAAETDHALHPEITPAEKLNPFQQTMLLWEELHPYNAVHYLRLRGRCDFDRLKAAIERAARANGLTVRAISRLYRKAPPRSGLMLGFAGFSHGVIARGVSILAHVIRRR